MDDCIFCQIIKGVDSQKENVIYEDDFWQALLVIHPHTYGHFIVYPKWHVESLEELGASLGELILKAKDLGYQMINALGAESFYLHINNGVHTVIPGSGHVAHLHMHVAPRYGKDDKLDLESVELSDYLSEVKEKLAGQFDAVPS